MDIHLKGISVADEVVDITYHKAQTPQLLPGESMTFFFKIHSPFGEPLDTMDDLYQFKGRFQVNRCTGISYREYGYEIFHFSFWC